MNPIRTSAIDTLLEQRRRFLSFIQRRVGSDATAEDILQTAYLRALRQERTLQREESAVAWFYRILRNAVIDHYRQQAAADRMLAAWAVQVKTQATPDVETRASICDCVTTMLPSRKAQYRQAIQQVDIEGASMKVFAEQIGATANNAAVRVHRARQAFKKLLLAACGACAKHGCVNCDCNAKCLRQETVLEQ